MAKELYTRLGLDEDATESQIEEAYKRLSADCDPQNGNVDAASSEHYKYLTEAYYILADMDRRALYDIKGDKGVKRKKRTGSKDSEQSPIIKAREILNRIFLCGAAVSAVLFALHLSGNSATPFYYVCGISLFIKIAEYLLRLIQ